MGGDSFQGTQKLTNQQYETLVPQILTILKPLYIHAQSYIPLPEKYVHGDIDILMIAKPNVKPKDIVDMLKIQRYIINNNNTINSVYKNKQIDFNMRDNQIQFQTARFYKSYSGFGAYLGLFLPSKQIKLSQQGLYALGYRNHIKFEYLLTNNVQQILKFYGLDYQTYQNGFKTRKQLFQYMRKCCFLVEKELISHGYKNQSKITKFFIQYLQQQTYISQDSIKHFKQPHKQTLQYFKKKEQYEQQFTKVIKQFEQKQQLNKKFNALHIMEHFNVENKQVNKMKQTFKKNFDNQDQYRKYVMENSLESILLKFGQVLSLENKTKQTQNQDRQKANQNECSGEKKQKYRKRKQRRQKLQSTKNQTNSNKEQGTWNMNVDEKQQQTQQCAAQLKQ